MSNTQLQIIEIPIKRGQHLADLKECTLGGLPHRVIFNKLLPGCGATTVEIDSKYNLIMIEPYRPVIEGKAGKHPELLGVYKGIYEDKILEYMYPPDQPRLLKLN